MLLYKGVQCIAHLLNQRSKRSEGPPRRERLHTKVNGVSEKAQKRRKIIDLLIKSLRII